MPFEITLEGNGLWSWIEQNPGTKGVARIMTIYKKAQKQALAEFMTGASRAFGNPGIARRFSEGYAAQIQRRTGGYMRRVTKFFGRYLPFTSPTPAGTAGNGHLRDLIKKQGTGFNLTNRNKVETVTTIMTLPAARVLNLRPQYRGEFLDLNSLNHSDGQWIEKRVHAIAWPLVKRQIELAERRRLRGGKI